MSALFALGVADCGAASAPPSAPAPAPAPLPGGPSSAAAPAPEAPIGAPSKDDHGRDAASMPYATVTDERLQHPADGDWLMYRRTYDGTGFSPLKQITANNVGNLTLAWSVNTDQLNAHETTPIVNHGRMFITTPGNNVIALDAKTVDDYKTGCYSTLAPLPVKGKILVGYSGGEFGVRGSVSAFDADTGKRLWRFYTVPAPNEPGGNTWKGDSYKRGGGSIWITGVFDPTSNTTYWGTGNPAPWVADKRPGDNLYTDSTLAIDAPLGVRPDLPRAAWSRSTFL